MTDLFIAMKNYNTQKNAAIYLNLQINQRKAYEDRDNSCDAARIGVVQAGGF